MAIDDPRTDRMPQIDDVDRTPSQQATGAFAVLSLVLSLALIIGVVFLYERAPPTPGTTTSGTTVTQPSPTLSNTPETPTPKTSPVTAP